jgi:ribosomal protein L11 methyltransferase
MVLEIGRRLRILAPGAPAGDDDRMEIVLAPGAFGSGEHETTASCLEILEGLPDLAGAEVLDLGSGTGILAIAAVLLGAASATCVDPDPRAVATAQRNGELNRCGDRLRHLNGTLDKVAPEHMFDLALGNLYGDILLAVAGDLAARVRPGGRLLLSGIAWELDWQVRRAFEALSCTVLLHRILSEYATVLLRRSPHHGRSAPPEGGPSRGF